MIKTNIKNNHIQIENLYKSIFADLPLTSIKLEESSVIIEHNDEDNTDAASLEIIEHGSGYKLNYWDGYSVVETKENKGLLDSVIPSWRPDISQEVDVVEELVRIKGYDPSSSPIVIVPPIPE